MPKLKYEVTQNVEYCEQCRFCRKQLKIPFTDNPEYELYCLIGNPGYMSLKLIKVLNARSLGYVTTERPKWCPLKKVEE